MDKYNLRVFVNCPFDEEYDHIFKSLIFAISDCGFITRCAFEEDDGSRVRIEKLYAIIHDCKFGIHDISRVQLDKKNKLPRFNMPLELGIFLGTKKFGSGKQKNKNCLILDKIPFRYQKFISDIAGQDIRAHHNNEQEVIRIIRNWLRNSSQMTNIPDAKLIFKRYKTFISELPKMASELKLDYKELIFADYYTIVSTWLRINGSR